MSVAPEDAATGPRVGFFESWDVAMEAQMRASSQYGIEYYMHELDWKQTEAMMAAGVEAPPQLLRELRGDASFATRSARQSLTGGGGYYEDFLPEVSGGYLQTANIYAGRETDDGTRDRVERYDARIAELQAQYPELGLKTSEDMFGQVRERAQYYDARLQGDRRTFGGAAGEFLGGALASMHPATDPLNFYTAGVGGLGKAALTRIAAQGVGQGLIEAVNQVTGVQTEREILGLSHGFADAFSRVAGAVVGGAALQGIGEGVAFGVRKWFRGTPNDPAPPPPASRSEGARAAEPEVLPPVQSPPREMQGPTRPVSYSDLLAEQAYEMELPTGEGRVRARQDLDYMDLRMSDWEGGFPVDIRPRTDTAINASDGQRIQPDYQQVADSSAVHMAARQEDPATFRRFDAHMERKQSYQRWLGEIQEGADVGVMSRLDEIAERIGVLDAERADLRGKSAKARSREEARALRGEAQALSETAAEAPGVQSVREALMREDQGMRDLAPLVTRAYSRAKNQWASSRADRDATSAMIRDNTYDVPEADKLRASADEPRADALADVAPLVRGAPLVANTIKKDADALDVATAVLEYNAKRLADDVEGYRADVEAILDRELVEAAGVDTRFEVMRDDGSVKSVSIRELTAETKLRDQAIEAMRSCLL